MRHTIWLFGALAVACGGQSKGSSTTFTTGVPANDSVGSLSPADQSTLCNDLTAYAMRVNPVIEADTCKFSGLLSAALSGAQTDAMLQAACQSGYDQCIQLNADAGAATTTVCDFSTLNSMNCTATVGQVTSCINDSVAETMSVYGQLPSCGSLTAQKLTALTADAGTVTSCTALQTACPSIVSSMSGIGG